MLELHDLTHEDDWRSNRLLHYPRALQKGASGRKGMREGGGRDARRDIAMMVRCYGILFSISENPEAGRKPACSLHTLLQEVN